MCNELKAILAFLFQTIVYPGVFNAERAKANPKLLYVCIDLSYGVESPWGELFEIYFPCILLYIVVH